MRSVSEAQQTVLAQEVSPREVVRPTEEARGYVLARAQQAPEDSPRFREAAMDGYAVRSVDTSDASSPEPVALEVNGEVPAGVDSDSEGCPAPGTTVRIFTGAPVPKGADAVVMQEKVQRKNGQVLISTPVEQGANIRDQGEEFQSGHPLLEGHGPFPCRGGDAA